jgi:aspartyl-tRNA(Asn)/glutamyl-tRNA(Gln) amidotransferase subunit C
MTPSQLITEQKVRHVAQLARIYLSDEELRPLTLNLERILEYVAQLKTLDTSGVDPTSHPLPLENVYRPDEMKQTLTQEDALSIAIEKKNGFFKVPKVIE